MKQSYAEALLRNGDKIRADEIMLQDLYSPIFKVREAHPDAEPNPKDFNEMIIDLTYDLSILNVEFCTAGYAFKDLIESTNTRLKDIKQTINIEKERQQDINMLCNKYTEFSDVIDLTGDDFTGTFSESDGVFSAEVAQQTDAVIQVNAIEGNGYEGNKYVYKNNAFLEDTINTSNRNYITDGLDIPYYEYSRITASNAEKDIFPLVNFDSVEAKCVISLYGASKFNNLKIESPQSDITLLDVATSEDGVMFKSVLEAGIDFNNTDKKYEVQNYIPGSGIICFPSTNYVKITLESKSVTDDVIAFYKTEIAG
jgi:hypothetical protein